MDNIVLIALFIIVITQVLLAVALRGNNSNNERLLNIAERDRIAFDKLSNLVERQFNDFYIKKGGFVIIKGEVYAPDGFKDHYSKDESFPSLHPDCGGSWELGPYLKKFKHGERVKIIISKEL